MWLWIVLVGAAAYFFYKWAIANNKYFKERKVPYLEPHFLIGGSWELMRKKVTLPESILKLYNQFPGAR